MSPKNGRIVRCTPASAPFGSPSARGYPRRGGVGLGFAFLQRARLGFPTPRPMGLARVVPQETFDCPFAPSGADRLLRWLRLPLICASRFVRSSREVGGNAGGEAAQNRARRFSVKRACRKTAALGFPPPAGVAPLSDERDDAAHDLPANLRTIPHRAASAVAPAILAPRGINEDALGRPKRARESCPA